MDPNVGLSFIIVGILIALLFIVAGILYSKILDLKYEIERMNKKVGKGYPSQFFLLDNAYVVTVTDQINLLNDNNGKITENISRIMNYLGIKFEEQDPVKIIEVKESQNN